MAHSRKGGNSINRSIFGININSGTISFVRHIVILNVNTCRILAAICINYRILPVQSNRTMLNSYNASSIFTLGRNMDIRTGITYNNLILVLCIQATSLRPAFCGYIDFRTLDINLTGCCRACWSWRSCYNDTHSIPFTATGNMHFRICIFAKCNVGAAIAINGICILLRFICINYYFIRINFNIRLVCINCRTADLAIWIIFTAGCTDFYSITWNWDIRTCLWIDSINRSISSLRLNFYVISG